MKLKAIGILGATIVCLCGPGLSAAAGCGDLVNSFGPLDYRTMSGEHKGLVEGAHFTPNVETLIQGKSGYIGSDIDYTLRAIPNHPRALLAMSRLGMKLKTTQPIGARFTTDCYFERAIRFKPDDPMPHLIYGIHLKDRNRKSEALEQLDIAAKLKKEMLSYEFPYNMALEYIGLGAYDKALPFAQKAYQLGAPFPTLRKKLEAAGKWREAKVDEGTPKTSAGEPKSSPGDAKSSGEPGPAAGESNAAASPAPAAADSPRSINAPRQSW